MPGLTITSKQMTAFEGHRFEDFRTLMVKHLREAVGGTFADQSDEDLLSYVDQGVKRAKSYGATDNDAFGLFIMMMTELGDDFDSNDAYPWAPTSLKDTATKDPNQRIANTAVMCGFYLSTHESGTDDRVVSN